MEETAFRKEQNQIKKHLIKLVKEVTLIEENKFADQLKDRVNEVDPT